MGSDIRFQLEKVLLKSRSTLIIAFGLATAGFGQFVFSFFPSTTLPNLSLSTLAIWQSVSFGVGLILGSPINGVLYTELALAGGDIDDEKFGSSARTLLRIGLSFFSTVSLILLGATGVLFDKNYLLTLLVLISLALQLIAAAQRAVLSAQGMWWRFSLQFIIEGLGRIISTFVAVEIFHSSIVELVALNVLVQLFSVVLPVWHHQWIPILRGQTAPLKRVLNLFLPLWLAAGAIQSLLSLSPVIAQTVGNASEIQIAALGGIVQIIRIPVTFSSPFTLPYLNSIASLISLNDFSEVVARMLRVIRTLTIVWVFYGLTLILGGILIPENLFSYDSVLDSKLWMYVALSGVLAPITVFLHSVSLLLRLTKTITVVWSLSILIYLVGSLVWGTSALGLVGSINVSLMTSGLLFSALLVVFFKDQRT